jgi:hypothetical protein
MTCGGEQQLIKPWGEFNSPDTIFGAEPLNENFLRIKGNTETKSTNGCPFEGAVQVYFWKFAMDTYFYENGTGEAEMTVGWSVPAWGSENFGGCWSRGVVPFTWEQGGDTIDLDYAELTEEYGGKGSSCWAGIYFNDAKLTVTTDQGVPVEFVTQ